MSVYLLVLRESSIRDQAAIDAYGAETRKNPVDPTLTPLVVYGAMHALEGELPDGMVMLKFDTLEAAKAWYYSPGYQAAVPHRLKAADYRAFIVQGL